MFTEKLAWENITSHRDIAALSFLQDLDNPGSSEINSLLISYDLALEEANHGYSICYTILQDRYYPLKLQKEWSSIMKKAQWGAFGRTLIWDLDGGGSGLKYNDVTGVGDLQEMGEGWEALKGLGDRENRYVMRVRDIL
jgi:hypothetical protein